MEYVIIHLNERKNQIVLRRFTNYDSIKTYINDNQIPDDQYSIITGKQIALFK